MRIATGSSEDPDGGVSQGGSLRALARALVLERGDLDSARSILLRELGESATVQAIAVIASFDGINRVADATGIQLDPESWEGGARAIVEALDLGELEAAREDVA